MTALRLSRKAGSLWQFSLAVYGQPQVPPACLMLQDRHGVDVNVLLYAGWRAWRGVALSDAGCVSALQRSEVWRQELVIPLRALRRRARELAEENPVFRQAYAALKSCELQLEKQQQAMLADGSAADAACPGEGRPAAIAAALSRFIAVTTPAEGHDIEAALALVADAIERLPRA